MRSKLTSSSEESRYCYWPIPPQLGFAYPIKRENPFSVWICDTPDIEPIKSHEQRQYSGLVGKPLLNIGNAILLDSNHHQDSWTIFTDYYPSFRQWDVDPAMVVEWDDIGFLISSTYRTAVVRRLAESPSTPSQIGSDEDIAVAHVSRALQQLRDKSMVVLLVPEERKKGRVYRLSEKGETVWDQIRIHNLV